MTENLPTTAATAALAGMGDMADLVELTENADQDRAPVAGMHPFLKMEKDGTWVYGPENVIVQEGSQWVINPRSLLRGYICWTNYPDSLKRKNDRLGEVMVPLGGRRPALDSLPKHFDADGLNNGEPWPWTDAMGVELVCISGEDEGLTVVYNTNSRSGVRMLNEYFDEMKVKAREGKAIAVITMEKDSYQHKTYGKIVTPVFEIHEWRGADDVSAPSAVEKKETRKAAARTRPAVASEPQDEAPQEQSEVEGDAPAPTRRRRRPAA